MRLLIYLFSLFILTTSYGQVFKGQIKFDDEITSMSQFLNNVLIENERTNEQKLTNTEGHFTINAILGDTLTIQSDFINKRYIIVRENHFTKDHNSIYVEQSVINLQEVKLHNLDKNLKNNIGYRTDQINDLYLNMNIDPSLRDMKPKQDFSEFKPTDVFNPIRIINHLSGRNKRERKMEKYENKYEVLASIEEVFGEAYFVETLKIPANKIKEFLRYADAQQNLSKVFKNGVFENVEMVLIDQSVSYRKLMQKESP